MSQQNGSTTTSLLDKSYANLDAQRKEAWDQAQAYTQQGFGELAEIKRQQAQQELDTEYRKPQDNIFANMNMINTNVNSASPNILTGSQDSVMPFQLPKQEQAGTPQSPRIHIAEYKAPEASKPGPQLNLDSPGLELLIGLSLMAWDGAVSGLGSTVKKIGNFTANQANAVAKSVKNEMSFDLNALLGSTSKTDKAQTTPSLTLPEHHFQAMVGGPIQQETPVHKDQKLAEARAIISRIKHQNSAVAVAHSAAKNRVVAARETESLLHDQKIANKVNRARTLTMEEIKELSHSEWGIGIVREHLKQLQAEQKPKELPKISSRRSRGLLRQAQVAESRPDQGAPELKKAGA